MIRGMTLWQAAIMALCLSAAGAVGAAGLYKWTDAQGNVHFTQDPPPQGQFQQMTPPPPPPASASATDNALKKDRDALTPPPPATADDKMDKLQAEVYQKNCEIAKHNVETFTAHRRIRTPDGKVVTLGDDERAAKLREAQDQVSKYCK